MAKFEIQTVRGHAVLVSGLQPGAVVVDAGAHRGEFSRELAERFGCECYLVEANGALAASLAGRFPQVMHAALGARDGRADFIQRSNAEAGGILARDGDAGNETAPVEALTVGSLMKRCGLDRIQLLKLDIEGAEFELLTSLPDPVLAAIDQITVEFHDFLPDFRGRRLYENVRSHLRQRGFLVCSMAFRTHGDVLLLNRRSLSIGPVRGLYLSYLARFVERLKQMAGWKGTGRMLR
jgi:FkbM family methyltransferase